MTDDRKRISIHAETFDELAADKSESGTWDAYLRRLKADADANARTCHLDGETMRMLVHETADEIEERLR